MGVAVLGVTPVSPSTLPPFIDCADYSADHVHNTVAVQTDRPPACSICNPPAPPMEYQARNLAQNLPRRYLGAPRSHEVVYRGTDSGGRPGPSTATTTGMAPAAANGATVSTLNGATVYGAGGHAPRPINDTTVNLPWAVNAQHNQQGPLGPSDLGGPVVSPQQTGGNQQSSNDGDGGQEQSDATGDQQH